MAAAETAPPAEPLARDARKRKHDAPSDLPSSTTATSASLSSAAARGAVKCAYCGFAAADLEQSLTHLREEHAVDTSDDEAENENTSNGGAAVPRPRRASTPRAVDQATRVGQLLVAHALQSLPAPADGKSDNAAVLEAARVQYERIVAFFASLQERDAGATLESLRLLFQDNLSMMSTLQDASRMALEQAQQAQRKPAAVKAERAPSPPPPQPQDEDVAMLEPPLKVSLAAVAQASGAMKNHRAKNHSTTDNNSASNNASNNNNNASNNNGNNHNNNNHSDNDGDNSDGDSSEGRASIHEEQAAQALTGLRALTPRVGAAEQEKKLQGVSAAQLFANQLAPAGSAAPTPTLPPTPVGSSSSRNAAYPSAAGFAPSLGVGGRTPLSITAPPPPALPGMGSPLFQHAPERFKSGGATPSGGLPSIFSRPLLAPLSSPPGGASLFGHRLPTPSSRGRSSSAPLGDWKSADAAQPKLEPASVTPVTAAGYYRGLSQSSGQTSPVKRKSITSKQLLGAPASAAVGTPSAGASMSLVLPTTPSGATPLGLPPATALALMERSHPARKANPRRWTKEEDEALRRAVESHREKNWKAIAAEVPGRNHTQCLQRWTKVLAPGLVKGHWSPQEDELLRRLVASEQKNWGEVAAKIPGRTSKQCRERWHNHLDPSIVRGAYTPEEDRIILEAQSRLGNRWSVIAAMLPGRTEDAVKIRWKSHCRVWRARKYLRKSPADAPGGARDGDDALGGESSESESLSGMETPLAMTPMTPGYGHAFAWPSGATPRSRSGSSNSNGSSSGGGLESEGGGGQ